MGFPEKLIKSAQKLQGRGVASTPEAYVDNIAFTCDIVANLIKAFVKSYGSYPSELEAYLHTADNAVCDLIAVLQRAALKEEGLPMNYRDPLTRDKD